MVDAEREEVGVPMVMRAELGWTVAELKREVAEVRVQVLGGAPAITCTHTQHLHLSVEHMRVALETYNNEGRLLSNSTNVLRSEGFYRKHTVRRLPSLHMCIQVPLLLPSLPSGVCVL